MRPILLSVNSKEGHCALPTHGLVQGGHRWPWEDTCLLPRTVLPSTGELFAVTLEKTSGLLQLTVEPECKSQNKDTADTEEPWATATSQYSTPTHAKYLCFARSPQMFSKEAYLIANSQVLQAQGFWFFVLRETSERIQHPFP